MASQHGTDNCALVTVIMPIRNEEALIVRSLGAVLNQTYPAERTEILIADGMSDDGTLALIRSLPGAERVRIVPNPRRIQAAGMNTAVQQAKGECIIRVDGHTVIAADYIEQCVRILHETGALNVGGSMDPVGITPIGRAIAAAGKSPFAVPSTFHVSRRAQYTDTVYLGAWPRWVFEHVGLYNERVGVNEDYELNYRIRKAGGRVYFSPAIRSQYFGRQTLAALAKQYFRYGTSKVSVLREHPASLRLRQLVAPAFVAWLFLGIPLVALASSLIEVWLAGLLAYAIVNLFFSVCIALRSGYSLLRSLPIVFLTIHFSWGLGFWRGLLIPM